MSKEDGEMDMDYVNSIKTPPRWVVEKAKSKLKQIRTQAEMQEWLISVGMTPEGQQNESNSKTKWRPMYISEDILDDIITDQNFGEEQIVAFKIGYRQLFDSLGKLFNITVESYGVGG